MDRVISVEYAVKDYDDKRNGYSPDRSSGMSPGRRGNGRGRSVSPFRKERASPDYGHRRGPSPYRRERASPVYGRGTSPAPVRRDRTDSDYDHGRSPRPRRERPSPDHGREASPSERVRPDYGSGRSQSPQRERIGVEDYRRGPTPDWKPELRDSPKNGVAESPARERYCRIVVFVRANW